MRAPSRSRSTVHGRAAAPPPPSARRGGARGPALQKPASTRGRARSSAPSDIVAELERIHAEIRALRLPGFAGEAVVGPPIPSAIFLLGQAPGPHEAKLGRPFAWKAGRTLFSWFEAAFGAREEDVRARVYMAAVVRCFPGKAKGGGDRVPSVEEILACRPFLEREIAALRPKLVIPVGRLAIAEVLGRQEPIAAVVGRQVRAHFHRLEVDVICLPHPSGASTWFKLEPGKSLLARALRLLADHPAIRRAFPVGRRG